MTGDVLPVAMFMFTGCLWQWLVQENQLVSFDKSPSQAACEDAFLSLWKKEQSWLFPRLAAEKNVSFIHFFLGCQVNKQCCKHNVNQSLSQSVEFDEKTWTLNIHQANVKTTQHAKQPIFLFCCSIRKVLTKLRITRAGRDRFLEIVISHRRKRLPLLL